MPDTQWPRYQVFLQEVEGQPHQDVGSVHAPDIEMAQFNARDVFARRPACVSMWVVPADAIFTLTAEQMEAGALQLPAQPGEEEAYYIFHKIKSAGTHTFFGQVSASSPSAALFAAMQRYTGRRAPFVWWAVPARLVLQSQPQDVESLYAPALEKNFRLATDFHTVTAMRNIKGEGAASETERRPA